MRRPPEIARREILDAAAQFLRTRPFRELKIGELMEQTKIGRSAFYVYFNDVYELVEALIEEIEAEVVATIRSWSEESQDPRKGLRAVLSSVVNLWVMRGPLLSGLFDAAAGDQRVEVALQRVLDHYDVAVTATLQQEMAAGLTRPIHCDEMATALVRGSQAYLKQRLGHNGLKDPLKVLGTLEAMWIHTIYPD
ncbi:MAG TPA: TetR/AcrR family transcriptional regulator [Nevskiaceae bacterium]|nr:TetR/AcrR family transcriptional regulator [Nevskiaceae bacterium]